MSGLFFASFFTEGSDRLLLAGLLPVFFIISKQVKLSKADITVLAVSFLTAFCVYNVYDHFVYEKITAYNNSAGNFCGEIDDVRFYDGEKASYTLDGKINDTRRAKITFYGDAYEVSIGDKIILENCEFHIPESDYLFDAENYYKSKNIFLEAENAGSVSISRRNSHLIERAVIGYREKMISEFTVKMGKTRGSFLAGIVFGETSDMNDSEKSLMYRCGVGHIMAVSGLHVSIMAAILMFIFKKLRINKYVSFALMNVFLLLMIIMVKSPISVIRAAIMLNFMYSAKLFLRQNDSFNSLSAAVLLICLSDPYSIYDAGFMLSIAGTFGIAVFAPYMTKDMKPQKFFRKLLKSTAVMLCVSLTVMPLNILYFDETSAISPITNVLLIPICIAAMSLGMLYAFTGGIISVLSVSGVLIDIILAVADKLGRSDLTHFSCGSGRLFTIALFCTVFVIFIAAKLKKQKFIAISLVGAVTIFTFSSSLYSRSEFCKLRIGIFGRGSNAAVSITYAGRTDVIDLSGHYKTAEYLRKYMASNGISQVSSLALTSDVQSQYAAYSKSFELVKVNTILAAADHGIEDPRIVFIGDSGFTIKDEVYTVRYISGIVEISYDGTKVHILPAKSELNENADITVFYGHVEKNLPASDGKNIYLDELDGEIYPYSDMNNFEIIISAGSGESTLRRL